MSPSTAAPATNTNIALLLAVAVTTTAATTYVITKRNEERKILKEKKEIYDRELMIKNKTLEARRLAGEPMSGTLIEGVSIDRVYLWEVEDLKKRFPSSKAPNFMKQIPMPSENPYFFPALRKAASSDSMPSSDTTTGTTTTTADHSHKTNYNQLITNHECILGSIVRKPNQQTQSHAYVRAGPRRYLHFDTDQVNAAIVTCGGLCPGLNNVIREITNTLCQAYGIGGKIYGIQGGFRGFWDTSSQYQPIELTPELVANIHHEGGTCLGSSRGGFDMDKILAFLEKYKINQLYVIGGDGTHRGAFRIHEGCMERVSLCGCLYV
jgi:6-phosphofructokinase 1